LRESNQARADDAIKAFVSERHRRLAELWRQRAAVTLPHEPAHLEDVGKIGRKAEAKRGRHLPLSIIRQGELLVETALP
jgi:hypothetical protein